MGQKIHLPSRNIFQGVLDLIKTHPRSNVKEKNSKVNFHHYISWPNIFCSYIRYHNAVTIQLKLVLSQFQLFSSYQRSYLGTKCLSTSTSSCPALQSYASSHHFPVESRPSVYKSHVSFRVNIAYSFILLVRVKTFSFLITQLGRFYTTRLITYLFTDDFSLVIFLLSENLHA